MSRHELASIRQNPFRRMDRYPYRQDKITALRDSIRATGFWDNVVGRIGPDGPEIAYGHHRLEAALQELGPDYQMDLIIRDLSDEALIRIMAAENMQEWGTSAAVEMETIRVVVEAYGSGQIDLGLPGGETPGTTLRFAPCFAQGKLPTTAWEAVNAGQAGVAHADVIAPLVPRPYTARTVAGFLGWLRPTGDPQNRVLDALGALELIEAGILAEADYDGLTSSQAAALTQQARQARREQEAEARRQEQRARQAAQDAAAAEQRRAEAEAARAQRETEAAEAARAQDEQARALSSLRAAEEERLWREAQAQRDAALARQREHLAAAEAARQAAASQATATGRHVGEQLRSGAIGTRGASAAAQEAKGVAQPQRQPPAYLDSVARRAAGLITRMVTEGELRKSRDQLAGNFADIPAGARSELTDALGQLQAFAGSFITELNIPAASLVPDPVSG